MTVFITNSTDSGLLFELAVLLALLLASLLTSALVVAALLFATVSVGIGSAAFASGAVDSVGVGVLLPSVDGVVVSVPSGVPSAVEGGEVEEGGDEVE